MATGDSDDIRLRLRSLIPAGWLESIAPVRDAVLGGIADSLAAIYRLLSTVREGTSRAGTAGWLLDLDAFGFFGNSFTRRLSESDDAWRKRYAAEIFRPRVTRAAIDKALFDLTGRHPKIVEVWNAGDCGAYDQSGLGYAGSDYSPAPAGGYDKYGAFDIGTMSYDPLTGPGGNSFAGLGCWGSLEVPYQIFVTAYRPHGGAVQNADGTDTGIDGYDSGIFRYIDQSETLSPISDEEIFACVARTAAAGVIAWTAISN